MALVLGIAGGVISAIGSIQAAMATKATADYNEKVANRNHKAALDQTYSAIEDQQIKNRQMLGSIRSAYAANGFTMSGSPLDVIADTTVEQSFDIAKIKYQGKMKAEGYSEEAALAHLRGESAMPAGYIGAASGMLAGIQSGMNSAGQSLMAA